MFVKFVPANAYSPIVIIVDGIVVFLVPASNVLVAVSIIAFELSLLSYTRLFLSTFILVNPVQFSKAELPMLVTLLGITTAVNFVQSTKAPDTISVTLSSITNFPTKYSALLLLQSDSE